MKIDLEVKSFSEIPNRFTGVVHVDVVCPCCDRVIFFNEGIRHRTDGPAVEYSDGTKLWYKEGKLHHIDGPAIEWAGGEKEWWIDGIEYYPIKLDDEIIVLDYLKGAHNIMWYKILIENGIMGYPDIPGLIDKE